MPESNPADQLLLLAETLAQGVSSLLKERAYIRLSHPPRIVKQEVIEYRGRMRVFGVEKFDDPTCISAVNYYLNSEDMRSNRPVGALIVFVEQGYLAYLLKAMRYPQVNESLSRAVLDGCGALANLIAGRFKSDMRKMGLASLEMSTFYNYLDKAPDGIAFDPRQRTKYEVNCQINGEKRLVVELTMGTIPSDGEGNETRFV